MREPDTDRNCPTCGTEMYDADDLSGEKANFVCPECAPGFVLANSVTDLDISDPLEGRVR